MIFIVQPCESLNFKLNFIAVLSLSKIEVNSSFTDSFLCSPVSFGDALKVLQTLVEIAFLEPVMQLF